MTTLRRATPADAAALTALRAHMHRAMGTAPTPEFERAAEAAFARRLGTPEFAAFVVEQDGGVVSCGAAWVEEHLPSPFQFDARRGHIASMSTDPSARRQGHGRSVLAALLGWLHEQGVPRVDLRATEDGRALYEEFGFVVLGGATMSWSAPGVRSGSGAAGLSPP